MKPQGKKQGLSIFANFWLLLSVPKGVDEVFFMNKRYNGNTGRVSIDQRLKCPTQENHRESLNCVFIFSQLCKKWHCLFFCLGTSNIFPHLDRLIEKSIQKGITLRLVYSET